MKKPLYQCIASVIDSKNNCELSGNTEWKLNWEKVLSHIEKEILPSGAGFDRGTDIILTPNQDTLVLETAYHFMDEHGGYDGWEDLNITVKPSLIHGITLEITGNCRDAEDYIHDVFNDLLSEQCSVNEIIKKIMDL